MYKILLFHIDRRSAVRELLLFQNRTTHVRGGTWLRIEQLTQIRQACNDWQNGHSVSAVLAGLLDHSSGSHWVRIAIENYTTE